jgi:site-specific DNA recombinase
MRAALYARVSSEEQVEGYSIDAQKRSFQSLARDKGWETYREYVDEGKSARTDNINKRPAFKEMITDALAGRFDVIVVHKLDRFARNLRITLEYFDKLSKANISFVSINENMDFSTPWGRLALTLLGGLAQFYSDNLSQETKKGWHERRNQGMYCGALPFGAMKGEDGIPVPDVRERKINIDGREKNVRNYDGLKMAFELAGQGKSDRETATSLNAAGYKTTGTHGSRPFSKDTVKDMLNNRFYIGYIPDGNSGWQKAKHQPFISRELFEAIQERRSTGRVPRKTINSEAKTYSLSYVAKCARCGGSVRMQTNPKGRARVYCASRAEGLGCDFSGTFLDLYESQIEWYLANFVIPDDYQKKILDAHSKISKAYDNINSQRETLKASLARLKDQYRWGHISQSEYRKEYHETETQLRQVSPRQNRERELKDLAHFLSNVRDAWREATQEQRNKLARAIFDEIKLGSAGKVVAVKPRADFEPFFRLSSECHTKDIGCDPGGIRTPDLHRDRVAC